MAINRINAMIPEVQGIKPLSENIKSGAPQAAQGNSFGEMLENALQEVNGLQNEADKQIEGLTLGKDGYTPHGAMVALEKADTAFQLMSAIRGKIIRAYEEVIRTQV
jgi:flagellar hook-basal body complex protein FliE